MTRLTPGDVACREIVDLVTDYLEGRLSEEERLAFEDHIASCSGCRAYLDQMRTTIELAGSLDRIEPPPPPLRDELLAAFRDWRRTRAAG